eukprot:TRINITY_DN12150_c0_g1_i13.p3 TRINITY_DN12150_c0_g1~~TRINITY_DN12150_c0_g1_i13.p3  ORF type:complete len:136 (+),score=8.68 TRINITY_DN12150_c0_g1_i13:778-1185(+)
MLNQCLQGFAFEWCQPNAALHSHAGLLLVLYRALLHNSHEPSKQPIGRQYINGSVIVCILKAGMDWIPRDVESSLLRALQQNGEGIIIRGRRRVGKSSTTLRLLEEHKIPHLWCNVHKDKTLNSSKNDFKVSLTT